MSLKLQNRVRFYLSPSLLESPLVPNLTIDELVCLRMFQCLRANGWHRTDSAKALGISIRTMRNYISRFKKQGILIHDNPLVGKPNPDAKKRTGGKKQDAEVLQRELDFVNKYTR